MRIGRTNIRSRLTANNQGMAKRVDSKLDAVIDAHAAKFKTALAVDGSVAFIFNKHDGIIPCTCRGMRNLNTIPSHEVGLSGNETDKGETRYHPATKQRHAAVYQEQKIALKQVNGLIPSDLDKLFVENHSVVEKLTGEVFDEEDANAFVEDNSIDVVDALFDDSEQPIFSGSGDPMEKILAATALGNTTEHAFTSNFVACPICYGSGYVDTWRLYNGERIVLDASEAHEIEFFGDVDPDFDEQPPIFMVRERSSVVWSKVKLPSSWRHLMRVAVFNKGEIVNPANYSMYYIHPSQPNTRNPLTYNTLALLSNSNLLSQNNTLQIVLESNLPREYPLIFTHVEFMFSLGLPVRMQVPEAEVPNEDEYADYNLNLGFEMPSDVEIKENSYVVDGKYKRVWKVTSINRKLSARGKSFGYTVNVRALHSFERLWVLMNVLGKPRNPFINKSIRNMDDEDL